MSDNFTQVLVAKASIYALVNNEKWEPRGISGSLMLYFYNSNRGDLLCRWWKERSSLAYQLVPGKLKPKGDRSVVVRAYNMSQQPPIEEILAVRFASSHYASVFKNHYNKTSDWLNERERERYYPTRPLPSSPRRSKAKKPAVPKKRMSSKVKCF